MRSKTRILILLVSAPIIAYAVIGGFLGNAIARDETYQQLRIFQDVVGLIVNNYVEEADLDRVTAGAMRGLAEGLDPDSAYLTPKEVTALEAGEPLPRGETGLEITRQYYLRVVAARDGSPAARAGIRPGDLVRIIDEMPTREMSAFEGRRRLRGEPGSTVTLTIIRNSQADPHVVSLTRAILDQPSVRGHMQATGVGYLRVAAFSPESADRIEDQAAELAKSGAGSLILDLRGTATGEYDEAIAAADRFVSSGTLAIRQARGQENRVSEASPGAAVTMPLAVLTDIGTSGPAEVFAAALQASGRAELIGGRTLGRAAMQKLVKLSNGGGLWLTGSRYLLPSGKPLAGLVPDIAVAQPDLEFGEPLPEEDETVNRAVEHLRVRPAA